MTRAELEAYIVSIVKTNGQGLITGANLQQVILQIVDFFADGKIDIPTTHVTGNIAKFDSNGGVVDSGVSADNIATKSTTYTKTEVDNLITAIKQFTIVVAETLPTASADTMYKIYLIPSSSQQTGNVKDEFITIQNGSSYSWEQIGSTSIDLSEYAKVDGYYSTLTAGYAENLVPEIGDGGTLNTGFIIRSTAEGDSVGNESELLGLKGNVVGGVASTPTSYKKVLFNQINPAQVLNATISTAGKITSNSTQRVYWFRVPKSTEYNAGWIIEITKAGVTGSVTRVAWFDHQPALNDTGTIIDKSHHRNSDTYYTEEGYIAVCVASATIGAGLCAHLAWSGSKDDYYEEYADDIVTIPQLTKNWFGKVGYVADEWNGTSLVSRIGRVLDLSTLTWTETAGDDNYTYTTAISDMKSGSELDSNVDGLVSSGTNLSYTSETQITPATFFAGKYCYYILATEVTEITTAPSAESVGDYGTEELIGTSVAPSEVTIQYSGNLRDKLRNIRAITPTEIDTMFNEIWGEY